MTIDLPLIVVLIALGYVGLKFARVPKWLVVVLLLLGFQTAHTFIAPAVDSGSRRTLKLPALVVGVLDDHRRRQQDERIAYGLLWDPADLVFATTTGQVLDAANVRRAFRSIVKAAGLEPEWTPRELRHSFVSLMSDHGIPVEKIARVVGHSSTTTTEVVYRKQLRPVITEGADTMDEIFGAYAREA